MTIFLTVLVIYLYGLGVLYGIYDIKDQLLDDADYVDYAMVAFWPVLLPLTFLIRKINW